MERLNFSIRGCVGLLCAGFLAVVFTGCDSTPGKTDAPKAEKVSETARPTIRIKAGLEEPLKDSKGVVWAADMGFEGGTTVDRPDLVITGTDRPELYKAERYSMEYYSVKVPNGNYTLKLHFSEDYDGLTDPTMRLFTYAVKDGDAKSGKMIKEVKDFGPWKASGAQFKAYVDTVPLTVTAGQITITFTPQVENPQINAIEIIPR